MPPTLTSLGVYIEELKSGSDRSPAPPRRSPCSSDERSAGQGSAPGSHPVCNACKRTILPVKAHR
jgi:hypothetical protein